MTDKSGKPVSGLIVSYRRGGSSSKGYDISEKIGIGAILVFAIALLVQMSGIAGLKSEANSIRGILRDPATLRQQALYGTVDGTHSPGTANGSGGNMLGGERTIVVKHKPSGCLGCLVILVITVIGLPVLAFAFKIAFLTAILKTIKDALGV